MPQDRFELSPDQLASARFQPSPGFEALRALRFLLHPQRAPRLHQALLARLRERTPRAALQTLRPAIGPRGYTPDFLGQSTVADPTALLAAVAATPPARVLAELEQLSRESGVRMPRRWLAEPAVARDRLVDALTDFWDRGMRREWDGLERILLADIATRSRAWANDGIGAVLAGLRPRVSWDGSAIVRSDSPWGVQGPCTRGIILSPSVLVWPNLAISDDPHGPAALYYPAQNAASDRPASRPTGLDRLLGATRAAVLRHLRVPARSTDVCRALSLSPATVSHHVGILRDAGLVVTSRSGTEAWHAQTALGAALSDA